MKKQYVQHQESLHLGYKFVISKLFKLRILLLKEFDSASKRFRLGIKNINIIANLNIF